MKKYYQHINISRGIAILLVIVGHALSIYPESNSAAYFAFDFIYSFHMPLFFYISGFCAASAARARGAGECLSHTGKRFKRLMIPYLLYGVLYVAFDIVGGKYTWSRFSIGGYALDLLKGDNANWQLWTLYVLFACAVLYMVLHQFLKRDTILLLSVALFVGRVLINNVSDYPRALYITIFSYLTMNFCFFCLGIESRARSDARPEEPAPAHPKYLGFGAVIFVLLNVYKFRYGFDTLLLCTAPLGIALCLGVSRWLERKGKPFQAFFGLLGDYCMPLYLFSNIIQVLAREILLVRLGWNVHVTFAVSVVAPIAVSIAAAKFVVRKFRILRGVMLGEW